MSDYRAVCSTSDGIISNSGCDRVSMHGIHLCDVDIGPMSMCVTDR